MAQNILRTSSALTRFHKIRERRLSSWAWRCIISMMLSKQASMIPLLLYQLQSQILFISSATPLVQLVNPKEPCLLINPYWLLTTIWTSMSSMPMKMMSFTLTSRTLTLLSRTVSWTTWQEEPVLDTIVEIPFWFCKIFRLSNQLSSIASLVSWTGSMTGFGIWWIRKQTKRRRCLSKHSLPRNITSRLKESLLTLSMTKPLLQLRACLAAMFKKWLLALPLFHQMFSPSSKWF